MCNCGNNTESATRFLLFSTLPLNSKQNKIHSIDANILAEKETSIIQALLFRKKDFKNLLNKEIMKANNSFLIETEHFNDPSF